MIRKTISVVLSAWLLSFSAVGNAYELLSERAMDQITAGYNLTGVWAAPDGGTYYINQLDSPDGQNAIVYWYGENTNYANVAVGLSLDPTSAQQATFDLIFSGVPKNGDPLGTGPLTLSIIDANSFTLQGGAPVVGPPFPSTGTLTRRS
jgi:hypothetical protein